MAYYGSDDVTIVMDSTAGTTVDVTQSIQEINGLDVEAMLEESHTFGDSWVEQLFTGVRKMGDITVKGNYDDAASTSFDVIFNDPGNTKTANTTTRTFQIKYGGTKTTTVEVWIKNYRRLPSRGALTKAEAVLVPSGAVTEA